MNLSRLLVCLVVCATAVSGAFAGSLPKPQDKPILTISGNIQNKNNGDTAQFDRAGLEALGLKTVETANPWYDGKVSFEGVSLDQLMKLVGAEGKTVTAVALNDYVTTIPLDDFKKFNVILALKRDGKYMAVRDKGPLFIIYPYDSDPQLQNQTYYTRSAWQVAKLIVE
ncbi:MULTISPECIES: molybdopterin-dependent oxidoreductase [unclassified Ochrobactrum]|uniref:molybdopterin-dependent oxidoreductase n=1 Tax=unclassified Ochrobactrum TaxID=239106 RepID=UPI0015F7F0C9|nr:hypothetical protein [Ochrobactrum sp. RH2CCR150]MDH7788352.1 hypothetical protein [Ochrobactrum sp. 19YEA23]